MAKRPVRKPFVTTLPPVVAIAALAVGCGARVEEPQQSSDAGSDTLEVIDGNEACPTSEPTVNGYCTTTASYCSYDACYAPHWRGGSTYSCKNNRWELVGASSCNPPPPDPGPCPATEPTVGDACSRPAYAPVCSYEGVCGGGDYFCVDGKWTRKDDPSSACPLNPPVNGTPCSCNLIGARCQYNWCGTYSTIDATCDKGTLKWNVIESTCNPPPPVDAGSGT